MQGGPHLCLVLGRERRPRLALLRGRRLRLALLRGRRPRLALPTWRPVGSRLIC